MHQHASQSHPTVLTDDQRWQAVVDRDASADGAFILAVRTTGVFCRPGCPARTPKRENVEFFNTTTDALREGYRPCKRCRPTGTSISGHQRDIVEQVRAMIDMSDEKLTLSELATAVGVSPWHLQRLFKLHVGLSPARYQHSVRSGRLREALGESTTVTRAMNDAGYGSSSAFYASAEKELGMSPSTFRAGGKGERIRFGIVHTWLGYLLVAATDRGIASLQMGDSEQDMRARLAGTFPHAELVENDEEFKMILADVALLAERPGAPMSLPVDARGTAFQHRVWEALRAIPAGTTRTYSEVAEEIGAPRAVRAVARACADNPVPLVVPCHRVIGKNGKLTGYRYGIERKRALLERESGDD